MDMSVCEVFNRQILVNGGDAQFSSELLGDLVEVIYLVKIIGEGYLETQKFIVTK
jgi:hypothetical protein